MKLMLLATALCLPTLAAADRDEATIAVRPTAVLARVSEPTAPRPAVVPGGGLAAAFAWGVHDHLDLGAELAIVLLDEARYPGAMPAVSGNPTLGELRRTTRTGLLRAGATLRLGVGWVPALQLGLGAGIRHRTSPRLRLAQPVEVAPDGARAELDVDVTAALRVGLEHRVTRRWTVGLWAGGVACLAVTGGPRLELAEASLTLGYTWYPLW